MQKEGIKRYALKMAACLIGASLLTAHSRFPEEIPKWISMHIRKMCLQLHGKHSIIRKNRNICIALEE